LITRILVHYEQTVRVRVGDQGGGCGECARVYWYTMSKQSGYECKALEDEGRNPLTSYVAAAALLGEESRFEKCPLNDRAKQYCLHIEAGWLLRTCNRPTRPPDRGFNEKQHSTDVHSPDPSPRVCMNIQPEDTR